MTNEQLLHWLVIECLGWWATRPGQLALIPAPALRNGNQTLTLDTINFIIHLLSALAFKHNLVA